MTASHGFRQLANGLRIGNVEHMFTHIYAGMPRLFGHLGETFRLYVG